MEQTKGTVKECPCCHQSMSLMSFGFLSMTLYYWACFTCPYMVNYQSVEASELKEVVVK